MTSPETADNIFERVESTEEWESTETQTEAQDTLRPVELEWQWDLDNLISEIDEKLDYPYYFSEVANEQLEWIEWAKFAVLDGWKLWIIIENPDREENSMQEIENFLDSNFDSWETGETFFK